MILKASQRGNGQNLAVHLMRADENEHVELHEIRGFASNSLSEAFKEAEAISRGTRCGQFLFSLSLNPPQNESAPIEVFERAIERIEEKLGLNGQPRAVVFHEKEGRRHAHCVWSRIDADTMTARQLSHFKRKLMDVSRELYLEHDWTMPRGLENPALRDPTNFTLAEWQHAKRTGVDPREIKSAIQQCWTVSDRRKTFEHALRERGFYLARGDRRGFVVMDYQGEAYSLARAINLKAKDVRARLGNEAELRTVAEVREAIAERMTPTLKKHIQNARLQFKHGAAALEHSKITMAGRHQHMRAEFDKAINERAEKEALERAARFRKGVRGLWDRISGQHRKIKKHNETDAEAAQTRDQRERNVLIGAQLAERQVLQEKFQAQRDRQAEIIRELRKDVAAYRAMAREPEPPERIRRRQRKPAL